MAAMPAASRNVCPPVVFNGGMKRFLPAVAAVGCADAGARRRARLGDRGRARRRPRRTRWSRRPARPVSARRTAGSSSPRSRRWRPSPAASRTRRRSRRPATWSPSRSGSVRLNKNLTQARSPSTTSTPPTAARPGRDHRAQAISARSRIAISGAAPQPAGQSPAVPRPGRPVPDQDPDPGRRGPGRGPDVPRPGPRCCRSTCPNKHYAYRQSRNTACGNAATNNAQTQVNQVAQYACNYGGTRVEYWVTEVTTPVPPKTQIKPCTRRSTRRRSDDGESAEPRAPREHDRATAGLPGPRGDFDVAQTSSCATSTCSER